MNTSTIVTRWWWVRHAPVTDHSGRLYGRTDVPANTSERPCFEALARALPQDAVWLTSDLLRTHQTADAIAEAGHAVPGRRIEADLDEQDFGAWHGLTWSEVAAERGDGLAHKYWVAPAHVTPPEGESFVDVIERVTAAVARRTAQHAGQRHRCRGPRGFDPRRACARARPRSGARAGIQHRQSLDHPHRPRGRARQGRRLAGRGGQPARGLSTPWHAGRLHGAGGARRLAP